MSNELSKLFTTQHIAIRLSLDDASNELAVLDAGSVSAIDSPLCVLILSYD